MRIAIPSLGRPETLAKKTLATLRRHRVPLALVSVFVVAEEEEAYKTANPGVKIVVGVRGLTKQREFIKTQYREGEHLVFLDDDIEDFYFLGQDRDLLDTFSRGFEFCEREGCRLWGVYPVPNIFFMSERITTNLKYIIGSCYGLILKDNLFEWERDDKEDFYRTLSYYKEDRKVIRIGYISVKSKYYTEPGGLQLTRTKESNYEAALKLTELFPNYCSLYIRPRTGLAELRLRAKP